MAKRDPIVSKVWKIVNKKRRYVGIRKSGRWTFLKSPSNPSKTPRKPKKRGKTTTNKRKKALSTLFGNVGWKGMLIGTALLTVAKYLTKMFPIVPPRYASGAAMIGTSFVPVSGVKGLRASGFMDIGSEFISDIALGGFGQVIQTGGYDV